MDPKDEMARKANQELRAEIAREGEELTRRLNEALSRVRLLGLDVRLEVIGRKGEEGLTPDA